jgi:tRNA(His) 5'-end guanylyltransferase
MRDATETLFQDMGKVGVLAYTQSDEISILLSDACDTKVEQWFGGNTDKINTIAASIVSVAFSEGYGRAHFDCRSFFIPRSEVANYFLWRAQDCARNSLSMLCHVYFTHKELEGKGYREQHEMLHGIGINWTKELRPEFRNGLFISKKSESVDTLPSYADVSTVVETAYAEQTQLKGVDYLP